MNPDDLRRWVENQRAAADRVAADAALHPLTPEESFAAAMALLRLDEEQNGNPFERDDPVTEREDRQMYENWSKLRAGWGRR